MKMKDQSGTVFAAPVTESNIPGQALKLHGFSAVSVPLHVLPPRMGGG